MTRMSILCAFLSVLALHVFVQSATPAQEPAKPRLDALGDPLPEGALARLGTTRFRHGGGLLGFSPDGKAIMYWSAGSLHYIDAVSGNALKSIRVVEVPQRDPRLGGFAIYGAPALSGDGKLLAAVSHKGEGYISILDTTTGKERRKLDTASLFKNKGGFGELTLSLSDDGKVMLATGGRDGRSLPTAWFDVASGQRLHEIPLAKDGDTTGQISRDGKLAATLEVVTRLGEKREKVRLRIFDAASGKQIYDVEAPFGMGSVFLELRSDGKTLLANSNDTLRLYDYTAGKELKEVRSFLADAGPLGGAALSRDGKQLFVAKQTKVTHWDVDSGKQIRQFDADTGQREKGAFFALDGRLNANRIALTSDGSALAVSSNQTFAVYDAATGKIRAGSSAVGAAVNVVRFTRDGRELLVGNGAPAPQLWDVKTAKVGRTFDKVDGNGGRPERGDLALFVEAAAFSSSGQLLAMRAGEEGLAVWNAATGKLVKAIKFEEAGERGPGNGPLAFAFAPRGDTLAIAQANGTIKFWNAATGQALQSWNWLGEVRAGARPEAMLFSLTFSADGRMLAGVGASADNEMPQTTVIVWEAATGKERLRLSSQVKATANEGPGLEQLFFVLDQMAVTVQFSPDGKRLLLSSFSSLHLIDALTGKDIVTYAGRMMFGPSATFSHDGKLLYVGRMDGVLRVLDAATGRVLRDFPGHTEPAMTLALSPDGKILATGSNDSTVLLWDTAVLAQPPAAGKTALTAKDLERLWQDLADADAAKAFRAIQQFTAAPADAVAFLRTQLKPIPPPDPKVLEQLLEDLDSQKFAQREKATADLEKLGDLAGPALRARVEAKPPLETKQRLDNLLAKLNGPVRSPDLLRMLRAVETLELIGTPAARETLAAIARGAAGHRMTEDAAAALERLKRAGQ